jgi:hypothetical protein
MSFAEVDFEHQELSTTLAKTDFTPASIGIHDLVQPTGASWQPPDA